LDRAKLDQGQTQKNKNKTKDINDFGPISARIRGGSARIRGGKSLIRGLVF
jgi:hypothetical protein